MISTTGYVLPESIDCYLCGGDSPFVREVRPVQIGSRTAVIEDEFYRCPACDEIVYLGGMMDESLRRATAKIREEDGLLTSDEIVAVRERYGLSQAGLEQLIGAGEKTVVRWERGTVCQNRTADTLLRVLAAHPDVVAELARERGVTLKPPRPPASRRRRSRASPAAPANGERADAA
jgi:HTH-type transcriptional regulator/antitoxin MqsA